MNNRLGLRKPHICVFKRAWASEDTRWHAQQGGHNALGWSPQDAYNRLMAYIRGKK